MASPIVDYFFSGERYIIVKREETGPGKVVSGPNPISDWQWPNGFGATGIDAALYSGSVCYFFKGPEYIQVTRGINGFFLTGRGGKPEIEGPYPISKWGWPDGFGKNGIDAALWSGTVTYFFSGDEYIRVTRKTDTDPGTTDADYPRTIYGGWGWDNVFNQGVKGALPSGSRCYFFHGKQYIRVSRGFELGGFIDPGYPANISPNWGWGDFGANGIDAALYSGGPLVAPGSLALSSRFNYVLTAGGKNITGLVVTIRIDNDVVTPTTDNGFSFQLNCSSPSSSDGNGETIVQQYMLDNHPNDTAIFGWINFWGFKNGAWAETYAANTNGSFILPADNTIKAGSVFTIAPVFDKTTDDVTACNWTYTDPQGTTQTKSITLTGASIAPIAAITLDIGGSNDGTMATFTSGQGTITYTASVPLTAQTSGMSGQTLEKSNMVYEQLPPAVNVSQLFGTAPVGWVNPDASGDVTTNRALKREKSVRS